MTDIREYQIKKLKQLQDKALTRQYYYITNPDRYANNKSKTTRQTKENNRKAND